MICCELILWRWGFQSQSATQRKKRWKIEKHISKYYNLSLSVSKKFQNRRTALENIDQAGRQIERGDWFETILAIEAIPANTEAFHYSKSKDYPNPDCPNIHLMPIHLWIKTLRLDKKNKVNRTLFRTVRLCIMGTFISGWGSMIFQ